MFDIHRPGNNEGTRLHTTPSKKTKDGLKGKNCRPPAHGASSHFVVTRFACRDHFFGSVLSRPNDRILRSGDINSFNVQHRFLQRVHWGKDSDVGRLRGIKEQCIPGTFNLNSCPYPPTREKLTFLGNSAQIQPNQSIDSLCILPQELEDLQLGSAGRHLDPHSSFPSFRLWSQGSLEPKAHVRRRPCGKVARNRRSRLYRVTHNYSCFIAHTVFLFQNGDVRLFDLWDASPTDSEASLPTLKYTAHNGMISYRLGIRVRANIDPRYRGIHRVQCSKTLAVERSGIPQLRR